MQINHETAMFIWNKNFGKQRRVRDYAGRPMEKGAYGDSNSQYGWNLDHILPVSRGGTNSESNIICCNIQTNAEKADKFPVFMTNDRVFEIVRVQNHFEIRENHSSQTRKSNNNQENPDSFEKEFLDFDEDFADGFDHSFNYSYDDFGDDDEDEDEDEDEDDDFYDELENEDDEDDDDDFDEDDEDDSDYEDDEFEDDEDFDQQELGECPRYFNEEYDDKEVNFRDHSSAIQFYEEVQHKHYFVGAIKIELHHCTLDSVLDFIQKFFDDFDVQIVEKYHANYEANDYYEYDIFVYPGELKTKGSTNDLFEDCVLLNTYLKYYFVRLNIIDSFNIFFAVEGLEVFSEFKNFNSRKYFGSEPLITDKRYGTKHNCLFINDLAKARSSVSKRKLSSTWSLNDGPGWYINDLVYTKLKDNLKKCRYKHRTLFND